MTRSVSLLLALLFVLTAAVGVFAGQQMQRSKFDTYLQSVSVSSMKMGILEANLEVIRDSVPSTHGIGIPIIGYKPSCRCFVATATVWGDELMKKPISEVSNTLMRSAMLARSELKSEFPEMTDWKADAPDPDFRMTFSQVVTSETKGISRKVLAEYSDGKLVFK